MDDESALRRWFGLEMRRINEGIASGRVPLRDLLQMEEPQTVTRGGMLYRFRRETLEKIASRLPRDLHGKLRLPVIFFLDIDVPDSCFLTDPVALEALQAMGELSSERKMEGGRVFIGRAIVFALMRSYPTAVQIAVH
ncbi:MAG: DUF61 family protein [Methanolinea sp.]|nr:DUF61 family protein [Methanolinea sp.]